MWFMKEAIKLFKEIITSLNEVVQVVEAVIGAHLDAHMVVAEESFRKENFHERTRSN